MTRILSFLSRLSFLLALVVSLTYTSFAQTMPQGRLTLSSTAPVMIGDIVGATSIYYLPYVGSTVPIPTSSAALTNYQIPTAGLSASLATGNITAGSVFDVYVMLKSGIPWLCTSPAWYSAVERHPLTGSSGYSDVVQNQGIWIYGGTGGTQTMGCVNGSTGVVVQPYTATYLGTFIGTGSGTTAMQFKPGSALGGTGNIAGIWNAYNRVPFQSISLDDTITYTYSSSGWREMNNSTNNRITWVDGLQQSPVSAFLKTLAGTAAATAQVNVGVLLDSTGAVPNLYGTGVSPTNVLGQNSATIVSEESFSPQMGLHYFQAMEQSGNGVTATFAPNVVQTLILRSQY